MTIGLGLILGNQKINNIIQREDWFRIQLDNKEVNRNEYRRI